MYACKKEPVFKTYDRPETTISSNNPRLHDKIVHLSKDTVYVITSAIQRNTGEVLKIDAGTLLKMGDNTSITINTGGRIEASGTAEEPIIFTSSAAKGSQGFVSYSNNSNEHSWMGISIHGNYPNPIDSTNQGTGILRYVRIEFAGESYNRGNFQQLPSLFLKDVGSGTTIENIETSYSVSYSSFQISGGNVNARNLVSYASGNSDFVLTDGYTGMLQNLLAYRHPFFSPQTATFGSGVTLAGLLINGSTTFPSISNVTVIGPNDQSGTNPKYFDTVRAGAFGSLDGSKVAALVVSGGKFRIRNSVFMGFPRIGFIMDDRNSAISLQNGPSEFAHSIVHSNDESHVFFLTPNTYPPYNSNDLKSFVLQPQFANAIYNDASQFMFNNPYNYNVAPDPSPKSNSPLLSTANFDGVVFNNSFFIKVGNVGALGKDNWIKGWTNFIPLQTNYNN